MASIIIHNKEEFFEDSYFYCCFIIIVSIAFAGDVDGKWEGTLPNFMGGGQEMKFSYNFKAEGNKITSITLDALNKMIDIQNGKIDEKKISFDIPVNLPNMKMTVVYKGELSGMNLNSLLQPK